MGAVKMPDWMNVEGGGESPLRRQQGGSPLRRDIEGDEDDQWKLYTNNPQANLDEESGRKRHLRKMNNAVVTAKYPLPYTL